MFTFSGEATISFFRKRKDLLEVTWSMAGFAQKRDQSKTPTSYDCFITFFRLTLADRIKKALSRPNNTSAAIRRVQKKFVLAR
jgi:hypothetical protein